MNNFKKWLQRESLFQGKTYQEIKDLWPNTKACLHLHNLTDQVTKTITLAQYLDYRIRKDTKLSELYALNDFYFNVTQDYKNRQAKPGINFSVTSISRKKNLCLLSFFF